jgi:pimeloyl-ACP methyl ester carboxylesterase
MLKYNQGDISINGVKIHYYRTGGGKPPFILLHGATDNGLCWTPVAEFLTEWYDVIMPDAQGHGLSDRLGKGLVSQDAARQVLGLMDELGLEKPVIMGHSMGAGTATQIAAAHSELLKAVILEDPAWNREGPPAGEFEEARRREMEAFIKELTGGSQLTREELIAECRKNNPAWSEAEILPWADAKRQFDPTLFSKLQPSFADYIELVPRIDCPTLLIISDGGIVSAATARHAAELWQSKQPFRWVQIKGAGHNIRREQFEVFRKTVLDFLGEIGKTGRGIKL